MVPFLSAVLLPSLLVIFLYLSDLTLAFSGNRSDNLAVYVYLVSAALFPAIEVDADIGVKTLEVINKGHHSFFARSLEPPQSPDNTFCRLSFYCNDDTIDVIPMAFLYIFRGKGGLPEIDFSNICGRGGRSTFPGSNLIDCSFLESDIKTCQAKGKIVTLSLGGATSKVGFADDAQAAALGQLVWDFFLGGNGNIRPLGSAVLDGIDLDIESGSSAHYATFVNKIRSLAKGAKKQYYITAAPQCPFPDALIGGALDNAIFDAVYVQFYNNFCETSAPSAFNFDTWDRWATTRSPNRNIKVYLGAPAAPKAASNGYVDIGTLTNVIHDAQKKYSSFGGVMLWDADAAYTNNRYDLGVKKALTGGSGRTTTAPPNPGKTQSFEDPRTVGRVNLPPFTWFVRDEAQAQATALPKQPRPARDSRFFRR